MLRLVSGEPGVFRALAQADETLWISRADDRLLKGESVLFFSEPETPYGPVANFAASSYGWDGIGLGTTELSYRFATGTDDLVGEIEYQEVVAALAAWSQVVEVEFTETSVAGATRTIEFGWATGGHGDGVPFDGPGAVIAHGFIPPPQSFEPTAGDVHFDDSETWALDDDVYNVALHEIGHALGLGHSDVPGSVMATTYSWGTPRMSLSADDIDGIRTMYAHPERFTITNVGEADLEIAGIDVAGESCWLTLDASTSGPFTLIPSSAIEVEFSIDEECVGPGIYSDTIRVWSNDPDEGQVGVGIQLEVIEPATLFVTPDDGLVSSGLQGGPFSPPSKVFTLSASGPTPISWTATGYPSWVTVAPAGGSLSAGTGPVEVTVSMNSAALTRAPGLYNSTV